MEERLAIVEFVVELIGRLIAEFCVLLLLKKRILLHLLAVLVFLGLAGLLAYLMATRPFHST